MTYRFHLLGLAHVPTSREYFSCAYTQKVVKLAAMLQELGHKVFFYGTAGSRVECDEFIQVGTAEERELCYGQYDWRKEFFKHDPKDVAHQAFNARAVRAIKERQQERDFLLCPMGNYHQAIAEAVKLRLTVESGIGYTGVFAPFRVWESYAWMNHVYGLLRQQNGSWYDAVIPNYWDPEDFHTGPKAEYYLYVGRLVSRKGLSVACEVTEAVGKPLIVAGQGDLKNVDGMDLSRYRHVQHVGSVGPERRAELMAGAIATFCPTWYIGPFEGVHIESMFCGTPVLTTDWGVFAETNVHGVTGYRCRTFDEFVWAARAARDLDPQAIRRYAVANFSTARVRAMYQHYFENLQDIFALGWYERRPTRTDLDWLKRVAPQSPAPGPPPAREIATEEPAASDAEADFSRIEAEEAPQAARLAHYLQQRWPDTVIVDVGCGPGTYVEALRAVGCPAVGVDRDPRVRGRPNLACADLLRDRLPAGGLALCLEVLEHLPEATAEAAVRAVGRVAPTILFSAAAPGQGGAGHVNCQPKSYWIRKFGQEGFAVAEAETQRLMDYMAAGPHMGWLTQNAMVLRRN